MPIYLHRGSNLCAEISAYNKRGDLSGNICTEVITRMQKYLHRIRGEIYAEISAQR